MRCSFKEWPFKIVFKSNELGTGFKRDLIFSAQYNNRYPQLIDWLLLHKLWNGFTENYEFRSEIDKKMNLTMIISNWMEYYL